MSIILDWLLEKIFKKRFNRSMSHMSLNFLMIFKKKETKGYFKRTNTKHFNFRQIFHAFDV